MDDVTLAVLVGCATFAMGLTGVLLSTRPPKTRRAKSAYELAFVILGCGVLVLVVLQVVRNSDSQKLFEKELREARAQAATSLEEVQTARRDLAAAEQRLSVLIAGTHDEIAAAIRQRSRSPQGFLQIDRTHVLPQYADIQAGKVFAVNIYSKNPGPTRVFNAYGFSDAYVEQVTPTVDRTVRRLFEEQVAGPRQRYLAGALKGKDEVGVGGGIWTTVGTSPLSEQQSVDVIAGRARIYFVSWLAWKDEMGQVGTAYDCSWLQAPFSGHARVGAVWHTCTT